jgi:hypothetical protein
LDKFERRIVMKLKMTEDDNAVVVIVDGKPVFVGDDGKDVVVDVPQLFGKITALNSENKEKREYAEGLELKLKPLDGIEDLAEFKTNADKAFETVKNFSDKDLVEAGKVDEIKVEMKAAHDADKAKLLTSFQEKETGFADTIKKKDGTIYKLMVSSKFAQSPYFAGKEAKTLLPPEIAESYFGNNFKVESNGDEGELRVVGYLAGNQIYSRKNPGELADFDEALETVIDQYPMKDNIFRAGKGGSGAGGGQSGGGGGGEATEIQKLEVAYKEAIDKKDAKLALSIKNRLFTARQAAT